MNKKKTKAETLPFTFPETTWIVAERGFLEHHVEQANSHIDFRWRHHVLDAKTKFEAQAVGIALLEVVEAHRRIFRKLGYAPPHLRELDELLPFGRYKLGCVLGYVGVSEDRRHVLIPIDHLYAEA